MDTSQTISVYCPFSSKPMALTHPREANAELVLTAAILENAGALWILCASNLGDFDLVAMETKLDLLKLSLTEHIKKTSALSEIDTSEIKSFFGRWEFDQTEYSQVIDSANLQIKNLPPFLREFFLSGIRQTICENHDHLYRSNDDFKATFSRFVELSIFHQQQLDRFDRLSELAFHTAGLFSTIRLETLKNRMFPFTEKFSVNETH